jgi:prevent-host-death family protein
LPAWIEAIKTGTFGCPFFIWRCATRVLNLANKLAKDAAMSTRTVNIHEAKTRLSELLAMAMEGEEVIIVKANKPMVKLVPIMFQKGKKRVFGMHRGEVWISEDFDEPLPDEFWMGNGSA